MEKLNNTTGTAFSISGPDIFKSLESITIDHYEAGIREVLNLVKDFLSLNGVGLFCYLSPSDQYRFFDVLDIPFKIPLPEEINLRQVFPYLTRLFMERKGISVSTLQELPEEAETDRQFLMKTGMVSLLTVPVISWYKNSYGIYAFSSEARIWDQATANYLTYTGILLVSAIERVDLIREIGKSEEKFRTIADYSMNMDIWILPDGTFAYISPSVEKITGYPAGQFKNSSDVVNKILHPDDRQETVRNFTASFEKRKDFNSHFRIVTKSGEIKLLETAVKVILDEEGNFDGYLMSNRDNTEGILLREELKKSEERYRHIVQEQTDLICEFSVSGNLLFANAAYKMAYRLKEEDIDHFNCLTVLPPEERIKVDDMFLNLTPEHPVAEGEYRIMRPDGTLAWEQWITKGIFDTAGKLTGALGVGRDITERKNMEIRLGAALEEISELNEKLKAENIYLKDKISTESHISGIFTRDPEMIRILDMVKQVAKTNSPVLIIGETGTGKELIAKAIHELSNRSHRSMITVNCGAIPPSLIENELFGREKGAYTGAMTKSAGRFELADKSTLFLDEIAELPLETQSKLLRVLQFGEYQMLGSSVTRKVNVRLIAATNRDLSVAIKEGTFRKDLFYRLEVFPIHIPPLRERKADIPGLVWQFVEELSGIMGKRMDSIPKKSMEKLMHYSWPGNIRELRNVVEYSMILADTPVLNIRLRNEKEEEERTGYSMEESERNHILKILEKTGWRVRGLGGAAEILRLPESTLRSKMKKLGISRRN